MAVGKRPGESRDERLDSVKESIRPAFDRLLQQLEECQGELREQVADLSRDPDFAQVGRALSLLGELGTSLGQQQRRIESALGAEGPRRVGRPARSGGTPIATWQQWAIEILAKRENHAATPAELARLTKAEYEPLFEEVDLEPLPSRPNIVRWRHYHSVAMSRARDAKLVDRDEDGRWVLTKAGLARAERE